MSALDVLRQVKQARRAEGSYKLVEWGSADFITAQGIDYLTRRELRNHLDARDLLVTGNRLELLSRLRSSIVDEQLSTLAYKETTDTNLLIQAAQEESGSVYSVGVNSKGQLGVGDLERRLQFTVVPKLRGLGVHSVEAGDNVCYAIVENHDIYVWGGGGNIKTYDTSSNNENASHITKLRKSNGKTLNWLEPELCEEFGGEEVVAISIGSSHFIAASRGGDCLVWGDNDSGQLGIGNFDTTRSVSINSSFPSAVQQIEAGANHTVVLTSEGHVSRLREKGEASHIVLYF